MRQLALGATLVLLLSACSQEKVEKKPPTSVNGRVLFATSFEELEGWAAETPSLTTEKARTGRYSIKVDQNMEFSQTYVNTLTRLSPTRFNKVRLTGWGYLTAPGAAALVFQITRADQTTAFYEKIPITQANTWEQVSKELTLPAVLDPMDQVRIYLWRDNATGPAYVDDVRLRVEP